MVEQLTVADVLERAADLIEPEGAWTQGALSRNAGGQVTGVSGFRGPAVCWCVMGATEAVAGEGAYDLSVEADFAFSRHLSDKDLSEWNDAPERTQAEVVAKLREAARIARESAS